MALTNSVTAIRAGGIWSYQTSYHLQCQGRHRSLVLCAGAGTTRGQPYPVGPPVILICDSLRSGFRAVGRTREAVDPPDLPGEGDHVSFVPDELERGRLVQSLHDHGKGAVPVDRSEEHTSELQSLRHLVCRLLLEKNNF